MNLILIDNLKIRRREVHKVDIEYFKQYGIYPEDFKIDVYRAFMFDDCYKNGVEVSIPNIDISVKCHSEKSQMKNKEKCLKMLKLIIDDMLTKK